MKAIETKYLGPTNTRGSRIKAYDCDGNQITIPYDYALSHEEPHRKAAAAFIDKMGWPKGKLAWGSTKRG